MINPDTLPIASARLVQENGVVVFGKVIVCSVLRPTTPRIRIAHLETAVRDGTVMTESDPFTALKYYRARRRC